MKLINNIEIALLCVAALWAVHFAGMVLPFDLMSYGIIPREPHGLAGILLSPFLHAGMGHLLANSLALAPLLSVALIYSRVLTFKALLVIVILGGGLVWSLGSSNSVHVGASGVIFGLIGYLLAIGIFRRELMALIVSLVVFFYYGWTVPSLFVVLPGVSWSGHFFGFLSGVLGAWWTKGDASGAA